MSANYKSLYMHYLDQNGVHYTDAAEFRVTVSYKGDNINSIPIQVFFDKNGKQFVQLDCWNIAKFNEQKMAVGLVTCNALNAKYRWAKFYLDSDMDVRCQADLVVEPNSVGEEIQEVLKRLVNIIDEAYPEIMKALWA